MFLQSSDQLLLFTKPPWQTSDFKLLQKDKKWLKECESQKEPGGKSHGWWSSCSLSLDLYNVGSDFHSRHLCSQGLDTWSLVAQACICSNAKVGMWNTTAEFISIFIQKKCCKVKELNSSHQPAWKFGRWLMVPAETIS